MRSGESTEFMIEFTPSERGECFREVYVFCNTEESFVGIQIHGNVR